MHYTIYGFVHFSGAAGAALFLRGQRLQVLPHLRDARDHPSIIPIHPAHAEHPPVRPAWPRLSRDRLWPAVRPGSADGDGWRRHAHRFRRAGRPGLAASCSWPQGPIQSFFFEQQATRERPEERRTARSRFGGWFLHERGSRVWPKWTLGMVPMVPNLISGWVDKVPTIKAMPRLSKSRNHFFK